MNATDYFFARDSAPFRALLAEVSLLLSLNEYAKGSDRAGEKGTHPQINLQAARGHLILCLPVGNAAGAEPGSG